VYCQDVVIPSTCGLFSPHQIDMEDFLKFDSYDYTEVADINLEVSNAQDNKNLYVELLMDISSSNGPVKRKPLNLCFALDRSASMEENNRMEKLKDAMKEILSSLVPGDYVSIVTYDDYAQVVLSSRQYNKYSDSIFRETIDRITIGGGTNMLAGMLTGYNEINKNHNRFYRNRLILMSDGVSTTGEKDPNRILKHTINYYDKGIETSTIGIGNNINFNLLHDIAMEGRGESHFIGDCDSAYIDIGYVLREEFSNMNANMENIQIEISFPKHLKVNDVYGASKVIQDEEKLILVCSNLYMKQQFVLVKFQSKRKNKKDKINVNMNFTEDEKRKNIVKQTSFIYNLSSEKMVLANKIIDAVNCAKNRLTNHQYNNFDCLDKLTTLDF
jgi:Mg-chelatase subunit ChlD